METAIDATHHLQNAMLCHTQLASHRNETLLLDILTPTQTALFLEWTTKNKERCRKLMEQRLRRNSVSVDKGDDGTGHAEDGSTLGGVSRQLEMMRLLQE